jgi:hypothetical protein
MAGPNVTGAGSSTTFFDFLVEIIISKLVNTRPSLPVKVRYSTLQHYL